MRRPAYRETVAKASTVAALDSQESPMHYIGTLCQTLVNGDANGDHAPTAPAPVDPLRSLQTPGAWHAWWSTPVDEPVGARARAPRAVGLRRLVPRH